jgi:phospholipid/cholesterol/gamma-HCH transport system substrate-binding protein
MAASRPSSPTTVEVVPIRTARVSRVLRTGPPPGAGGGGGGGGPPPPPPPPPAPPPPPPRGGGAGGGGGGGGGGGAPPPPPPAVTANDGGVPLLIAPPSAGQDWDELARQVLRRVDGILVDNADPVKSLIGNLDIFSQVLARNSDRIDGILAGLERMTGGAAAKAALPIYDLAAPTTLPVLAEAPHWQLLIPEPTILLAFNSDKITVAPAAGETTALADAQWSDNLPILFQEKVVQTFENAGFGASVSRPRDGFTADYQLLLDIRRFVVATSPAPMAEIEFVAKILGPDGKIVVARTFEATAPATAIEAAAAAASLNEAFGKGVSALVPWAAEAIGKASAATPGGSSPSKAAPGAASPT